ncbi:MAG TPA: proton-conducting transporter membrane subunit, partial [Planctomycetaceae bacterium]|nr:proton-conducting transporter membrane subunit [Planctomycetaceae bacterium]
MSSLLVITILLPLAAAVLLLLLDPKAPAERARSVALLATLATMGVSWGLASQFVALPEISPELRDPIEPRLELRQPWLTLGTNAAGEPVRLEFYLGIDGISLSLILLTTLLCVSSVLVSWTAITDRAAEFYAALLVLETGLIGVFCAFDLMLFYVFFEFTLIPLYFLVGLWGGPLRKYAAGKFFIYTLAGSLITLLGLVSLVVTVYNRTGLATPFSIPDLAIALEANPLLPDMQSTLFLAIAAGFMVKVPLFP